jgi:AcrR family transcriptional regulator
MTDGGIAARGPGRRPRRDALRNREAIVDAARHAYSEGETGVRMEEIARRAGVGVGTLYRHFPTRDALVEAVYRRRVDELCAAAARLSEQFPPGEALHRFMQEFIHYTASGRGMATAMEAIMTSGSTVFATGRRRMVEALAEVMAPAMRDGSIRDDVSPEFLFRALAGICGSSHLPNWVEGAHVLVDLVHDGLRSTPRMSAKPAS